MPKLFSRAEERSLIMCTFLLLLLGNSNAMTPRISTHALPPYSFSTLVDTSFADLMAIFSRAVRAVDPSVSAAQAGLYAEYIIRIASWEVQRGRDTCMATLATHFPSLKARVMEKVKFSVPSVYIGK